MKNRFEKCAAGAVFLDLIFAMLPILLIVVYTLTSAAYISETGIRSFEGQSVFHKLVSVSDVVVKQLAAEKSGGGWDAKSEPNFLGDDSIAALDSDELKDKIGLKSLSIFLSEDHENDDSFSSSLMKSPFHQESGTKNKITNPGRIENCIYRIVVVGESRKIRKLFVCGT